MRPINDKYEPKNIRFLLHPQNSSFPSSEFQYEPPSPSIHIAKQISNTTFHPPPPPPPPPTPKTARLPPDTPALTPHSIAPSHHHRPPHRGLHPLEIRGSLSRTVKSWQSPARRGSISWQLSPIQSVNILPSARAARLRISRIESALGRLRTAPIAALHVYSLVRGTGKGAASGPWYRIIREAFGRPRADWISRRLLSLTGVYWQFFHAVRLPTQVSRGAVSKGDEVVAKLVNCERWVECWFVRIDSSWLMRVSMWNSSMYKQLHFSFQVFKRVT